MAYTPCVACERWGYHPGGQRCTRCDGTGVVIAHNLTTDERFRLAAKVEEHPHLSNLSWNTARYTRAIVEELTTNGTVKRPATRIWRSRIYNAARRAGLQVTTHTDTDHVYGTIKRSNFTMNNVQQRTFAYLTSDSGGTSYRSDALRTLTEDGFFTAESEPQSENRLREFIQTELARGRFCNDGINRFSAALLGEGASTGPRTDGISLSINIQLTHESGDPDEAGYDDVNSIVYSKITTALNLLRGEGWNISDATVNDWYTD